MEKEIIITASKGREIEKIEIVDGAAVITFKKKERKLPKSWDEFCKMFPCSEKEYFISTLSEIVPRIEDERFSDKRFSDKRHNVIDRSILPDRATAEAILSLCQLIQLRNVFNGDWVPDWTNVYENKFTIEFDEGEVNCKKWTFITTTPLYFKTEELRDEFLEYFRPLIERIKPLYGIKEGGEE